MGACTSTVGVIIVCLGRGRKRDPGSFCGDFIFSALDGSGRLERVSAREYLFTISRHVPVAAWDTHSPDLGFIHMVAARRNVHQPLFPVYLINLCHLKHTNPN